MGTFKKPQLPSATPRGRLTSGSGFSAERRSTEDLLRYYAARGGQESRLLGLSDATGSMSGIWRTTRQQIHAMIERIEEIGSCEVQWVAFRDYDDGNDLLEASGWHREAVPLLRFIEGIVCKGGGDRPEAVEHALKFAADDARATRVVLIGDAPPHAERDYRAQAERLAVLKRPVYSFVVGQAPDTFRVFEEISTITGGACATLGSEQDLLDLVALTAAHDIGGGNAVEDYLARHAPQLTEGPRRFAQKLLNS